MDPFTKIAVKVGTIITKGGMIALETKKEIKMSQHLHNMNPLGNMFFYDIKTKKCEEDSPTIETYLKSKKDDLYKLFYKFLKITGNSKYFTSSVLGKDVKQISKFLDNKYEINYAHYIIYFVGKDNKVSFYSILSGKTFSEQVNTKNLFTEINNSGYFQLNDNVITKDKNGNKEFTSDFDNLRNELIKLENLDDSKKYTNSENFKTKVGVRKSLILLNFEKLCQIIHFYFCGAGIDILRYEGRKPELMDLSMIGNFKYPTSHRLHYTRLGPFTGLSVEQRQSLKEMYPEKIKLKDTDDVYDEVEAESLETATLDINRFRRVESNVDTSLDTQLDLTSLDSECLKFLLDVYKKELKDEDNDINNIILSIKIEEINKIIKQRESSIIPEDDLAVVISGIMMSNPKGEKKTTFLGGGKGGLKNLKQKIKEYLSFDRRVQKSFRNINNAAYIGFNPKDGILKDDESNFIDLKTKIAKYLNYSGTTFVKATPFNSPELNNIYGIKYKTNEYIQETYDSLATNTYNPSSWESGKCTNNIYVNFTQQLDYLGKTGRSAGGGKKSKIMSKKINYNRNKNIKKTKKLNRNK